MAGRRRSLLRRRERSDPSSHRRGHPAARVRVCLLRVHGVARGTAGAAAGRGPRGGGRGRGRAHRRRAAQHW